MTGWFIGLILLPVVLAETGELAPWLARRCLEWGSRRLSDEQARERYCEEWHSDLERVPGKITKLGYAATVVLLAVPRLRWHTWRVEREVPGMRAAAARAAGALDTAGDIDTLAHLIASGVACSLGFQHVAVNLVIDGDDLSCLAAVGPPEMQEMLLGNTCARSEIDKLMASCTPWGMLRFVRSLAPEPDSGIHMYTHDAAGKGDNLPDTWRSDDGLLAPFYGPEGELLGVLSLDVPVDGRIPGFAQRALIEAYASRAAARLFDLRNRVQPPSNALTPGH